MNGKKKSFLLKIIVVILICSICCIKTYPVYAENIEENERGSITIALSKPLAHYFGSESEHGENKDEIHHLTLKTKEEYRLSMTDFEFIISDILNLESLDVRESAFDSEETYWKFYNYFIGIEDFEFVCTEAVDLNTDNVSNGEIVNDADESIQYCCEDENIETLSQYELKLNGICLLDKGNKADVGVAYDSTDPNVEFRWLQYDLSKAVWSEVSGWLKSNWITWQLRIPGDYWIYVEARTSDGQTASMVYGHRYKGVSVELSGICVLNQGIRFDMGVAYQTNDPEIKFRWKIYDLQEKKWTLLQKETSGNWTSWSPKVAGNYWIHVEAVTSLGDVVSYTMGFSFEGLNISLNGICTIQKGDKIDVGVAYETNDADVLFRWKEYNLSTEKWSLLTEWSRGNWMTWKPSKAGDYWLYVEAKLSTGDVQNQVCGYRVNNAKITSFRTNPESPNWVESTIQLSGKYQDITNEVENEGYIFYDGAIWRELEKNEQGALWIPESIGNYLLCYQIFDKSNNLIDQSFLEYSIEIPYVNLNGINVRNAQERQLIMSVNSETNDRDTQYRWLYYDVANNIWGLIRDWNSLKDAKWTAPKGGNYWLRVEAKTHDGTLKDYTIGYVVRRYQNPSQYYQIRDNITLTGGDYNLSYGYEGLKVMYVMRKLGVGYGIGMGGAFYGDNVILAVKAFQQNSGLPVTGVVDYNTWITMGLPWQDWFNLGAYVSPLKVNADSSRQDHIEAMINTAYSYLGTPYVIGAAGTPGSGIDCSGLVMQALYSAGIDTSPINPVRHSYPGYEY